MIILIGFIVVKFTNNLLKYLFEVIYTQGTVNKLL